MPTKISDQVRGKTVRLSWTDGPTKGTTHEHVFHEDGTVEWHSVGSKENEATGSESGGDEPKRGTERPRYAGVKITDDVCLVSYLSHSGDTLTVTLNFKDGSTAGVASNEKEWFPVRGAFEVVGSESRQISPERV